MESSAIDNDSSMPTYRPVAGRIPANYRIQVGTQRHKHPAYGVEFICLRRVPLLADQ